MAFSLLEELGDGDFAWGFAWGCDSGVYKSWFLENYPKPRFFVVSLLLNIGDKSSKIPKLPDLRMDSLIVRFCALNGIAGYILKMNMIFHLYCR